MRTFEGKEILTGQPDSPRGPQTPLSRYRYNCYQTVVRPDLLLEFKFEREPLQIESCLFVWPMPPSTSSGHQYFKSQSAFLRPARSDEWRVIGAFHKPKSALVSSSPLTLSSRCLCIWIVIWTTKSDTDAICEQISSCSDLLSFSHHHAMTVHHLLKFILWKTSNGWYLYLTYPHHKLMERTGPTNEVGNTSNLITKIWMEWEMAPSTDPRQHHHQDAHIPQLKGIRHLSISQISSFHILWFFYDGLFCVVT